MVWCRHTNFHIWILIFTVNDMYHFASVPNRCMQKGLNENIVKIGPFRIYIIWRVRHTWSSQMSQTTPPNSGNRIFLFWCDSASLSLLFCINYPLCSCGCVQRCTYALVLIQRSRRNPLGFIIKCDGINFKLWKHFRQNIGPCVALCTRQSPWHETVFNCSLRIRHILIILRFKKVKSCSCCMPHRMAIHTSQLYTTQ